MSGHRFRNVVALISLWLQHQFAPPPPPPRPSPIKTAIEGLTLLGIWVAAGVAVWAILDSREASERQRTVMASTLEEMQLEQRAWVSAGPVTITEPLRYDTNGIRMTLQFPLKNTGKNPGTAAFVAIESDLRSVPDAKKVCSTAPYNAGLAIFSGDVIGAGYVTYVNKDKFSQDSTTFRPRDISVIGPNITACIIYRDAVTGKWHLTPYQYKIQMAKPRPGRGCCGISVGDGDIPQQELAILQWPLMELGPD